MTRTTKTATPLRTLVDEELIEVSGGHRHHHHHHHCHGGSELQGPSSGSAGSSSGAGSASDPASLAQLILQGNVTSIIVNVIGDGNTIYTPVSAANAAA